MLTTLQGLLLALIGGVGLAILFNQSRLVEYSFYPFAVILQVTPIVAIAPLLLIYLPQHAAVLACAWLVAFFPVLANTTLGLNSVDRNLGDLFHLYGASRWQVLMRLKLPSALPYMLEGLKIAGGLSLIGAVVAEISAGSAGAGSGLAYRIAESGYRLNIPRMFAALLLLSRRGHRDFLRAVAVREHAAAALARERDRARTLTAQASTLTPSTAEPTISQTHFSGGFKMHKAATLIAATLLTIVVGWRPRWPSAPSPSMTTTMKTRRKPAMASPPSIARPARRRRRHWMPARASRTATARLC